MKTIIKQEKALLLDNKETSRKNFTDVYDSVNLIFFLCLLLGILSPFFVFLGIMLIGWEFWLNFYPKYLIGNRREAYRRMNAPVVSFSHWLKVGYEIFPSEIDKHIVHLRMLNSNNPEEKKRALKYLKKMEGIAKSENREVGLSKSDLVTHFWTIGTTGAGKTSFIMQIIKEVLEKGGGLIFIDGKADMKMFYRLYNIAKECGREHDIFLVNTLPVEEFKEHTNTFNPIEGMPPTLIVEFFTALLGEASGDQAYWQGRGRSLLMPIVFTLVFRRKHYKENFTITSLKEFLSDVNKLTFLAGFMRAMILAYEKKLAQNVLFENVFVKAKLEKGVVSEEIPYVDALFYYFLNHPDQKEIMHSAREDFEYLFDIYQSYLMMTQYVKTVGTLWWQTVLNISNAVIDEFGDSILEIPIEKALRFYGTLVESELKYGQQQKKKYSIDTSSREVIMMLQQHAYAQQQWDKTFFALNTYSYIFSSLEPHIDILDIIKNQKLLYVLLPALKQSQDTVSLLGRLFVIAIKTAVSYALGAPVHNLSKHQVDVIARRITPVPVGLCVFDEYGSYPVSGIDTLLAQVRSINIGVILSTQDYTSARVEGKDENSVKRAWANTQKLILRVKDNETLKMLEEYIEQQKTVSESFMVDEETGWSVLQPSKSETKDFILNPKIVTELRNGAGIFITEGQPVLTQIYWASGKEADRVVLNKYRKF